MGQLKISSHLIRLKWEENGITFMTFYPVIQQHESNSAELSNRHTLRHLPQIKLTYVLQNVLSYELTHYQQYLSDN